MSALTMDIANIFLGFFLFDVIPIKLGVFETTEYLLINVALDRIAPLSIGQFYLGRVSPSKLWRMVGI
jgi:hypothetical protein